MYIICVYYIRCRFVIFVVVFICFFLLNRTAMRMLQDDASSSDESDDVYNAETERITRLSIRPERITRGSFDAKSNSGVKQCGRPVRQLLDESAFD